MTRGRAILGIGPGERVGNEPYGVDWAKPVARFEEALATIRALWNSKRKLVNRDSPFFPLRDAMFALPPYKGKWPEIWIAAHGPRMLRGDGSLRRRAVSRVRASAPGLCGSPGGDPVGGFRHRAGPDVDHMKTRLWAALGAALRRTCAHCEILVGFSQ